MSTRGVVPLAILMALAPVSGAERPQPPARDSSQITRAKEILSPSAPHDRLAALAGTWNQEVDYASGGVQPLRAVGQVTNRVVLGGRFLVSEGSALAPGGGLSVESTMIFGFDGRSHEYTVILLDTFGTYYVTAAGRPSDDGGPVVMHGETAEPGGTKKFDVILHWIDDDTYRTEVVFHLPDRAPVLAVATTYRRVAPRPAADVTAAAHRGSRRSASLASLRFGSIRRACS